TLLPLTPRIEMTSANVYYASILDEKATLSMSAVQDGVQATATGVLRSVAGAASPTTFRWAYAVGAASYTNEGTVSQATGVHIVEPFVANPGTAFETKGADTLQMLQQDGHVWQLKVVSSTGVYQLSGADNRAQYWSPFPGFEAYPLTIIPSGAGA